MQAFLCTFSRATPAGEEGMSAGTLEKFKQKTALFSLDRGGKR